MNVGATKKAIAASRVVKKKVNGRVIGGGSVGTVNGVASSSYAGTSIDGTIDTNLLLEALSSMPVVVKQEAQVQKRQNFTAKEDEMLCYAWVSASMDPTKGNNQKGFEFYQSISKKYRILQLELDVEDDPAPLFPP
jgi:hypothetical protein